MTRSGVTKWRFAPAVFLMWALSIVASLVPTQARADELPAQFQSVLMTKGLEYENNLKSRAGNLLTIAVIFKAGNADSERNRNAIVAALNELISSKVRVQQLPIRVVTMSFDTGDALDSKLDAAHAGVAYVCVGLGNELNDISAVTRRRSVLTMTGDEALVRRGLSVGLLVRNEKPSLLLNLPASKAEGAAFDAAFVRIADVVR